jgi:signal transduction histidine kinase
LERDLHDGAQQEVVALTVHIRLLEDMAREGGAEEVADVLSEIAADLEAAVDEIRSLARGSTPPCWSPTAWRRRWHSMRKACRFRSK